MRLIRWKAVIPLGLMLALVTLGWWLLADWAVRRTVEYVGAELVGARVDVASARVSLRAGSVALRGLEVTNPDEPMTNLVQADEIVARVRTLPLLEKKVIIDTMAIRGVQFGTRRRTSGALARKSATAVQVAKLVSDWAGRIRIPPLNLKGVNAVVDLSRIRADSLRTIAGARAVAHQGDSLQGAWRQELTSLGPGPQVDSARALVDRLKQADVRALGLAGTRDLITSARASVARIGQATDRVKALETRITSGVGTLRSQLDGLAAARAADYAYARGLVNLPSLDAPDLSPALFGELAVQRIRPVLYWLSLAERYLPPGLDPRRETGPKRVRASGSSVRFPRSQQYPAFLLLYAGADAQVGGEGAVAGRYAAQLTGLTSSPTVYGRPTRFLAVRAGAARGPRSSQLGAVLNHVRAPISDSVLALLDGVSLPAVALPAAGARLSLGAGTVQLRLARSGDNLDGSLTWRTANARWTRADSAGSPNRPTAQPPIGSSEWAEGLLWRTVSRLQNVEVETRISGPVSGPALGVRSNVGQEVAQALRREMGAEVGRQEQRVRARVDSLVGGEVKAAQERVGTAQTQVQAAVSAKRAELEVVRGELEGQIREMMKKLPVRIP